MGTSLSGLTPATTFDGLLKVGDNDPLTADLKAISTGDGTDTILQLSDSTIQVNGDLNIGSVHKIYQDNTNLNIVGNSGSTALKYFTNFGNNNTNQFGLNNFFRYQVGIGFTSTQSSAMLNVKGFGTTSATTSLLVQNSAGTEVFKVVDDNTMFYHTHKFRSAGGYLYIEGEGNVDRSLKIGTNFTASSYNGHIFKTYDGTAYSEAMRITGANDQFVGIGETTPTARLHVKGSGTTSATTSLLVQNSDGAELLKVLDTGDITIDDRLGIGIDYVRDLNRIQTAALSIGSNAFYAASDTQVHIKGKGTTSATTALLVQKSDGVSILTLKDNGDFTVGGSSDLGIISGGRSRFRFGLLVGDTSSSETSAVLEAKSTTQGFLPPRMTDAERDAIATPAAGLMIYDTTNNQMNYWNGSTWIAF